MHRQFVASVLAFVLIAFGCGPDGPGECVQGQRGCACTPLGDCGDDLVCHSQQCVETHRTALEVSALGARACEVLFQEGDSVIAEVDFRTGTRGSEARRGSKESIAFISEADTDLTGRGVEVRWLGNGSRPDIEVLESECFDRLGHSIPGSSVSLR